MSTATITAIPTTIDGIDVPQDQLAAAEAFVGKVNGPSIFPVEWKSVKGRDDIRKGHKHREVVTVTEGMAGIAMDYANLPDVAGREVKPLKWGEWLLFPLLITHKGNLYARVYPIKATLRVRFYIDGLEVTREQYVAVMNPSALSTSDGDTFTYTIKMQNLKVR